MLKPRPKRVIEPLPPVILAMILAFEDLPRDASWEEVARTALRVVGESLAAMHRAPSVVHKG